MVIYFVALYISTPAIKSRLVELYHGYSHQQKVFSVKEKELKRDMKRNNTKKRERERDWHVSGI
jgi:hypothetical protein